jgi:hypothetical protein
MRHRDGRRILKGQPGARPAMTSTTTTTATTTLVYRGVPYQKGELHQTTAASPQSAPMLTYRGVPYSSGSGSYRVKTRPISRSLHRMIELQFLGNHYQRAW